MNTYRIFMKSGRSFEVRADDCSIKYSAIDGSAMGYKFDNPVRDGVESCLPIYLNVNDISAVVQY